jgi:hypothetical protein
VFNIDQFFSKTSRGLNENAIFSPKLSAKIFFKVITSVPALSVLCVFLLNVNEKLLQKLPSQHKRSFSWDRSKCPFLFPTVSKNEINGKTQLQCDQIGRLFTLGSFLHNVTFYATFFLSSNYASISTKMGWSTF